MLGLSHPSPYDAVDLSNNVVMFDVPPPEVQDPPPLQNDKLSISVIAELSCGTNTQAESHLFEMDLRIRNDQCSPDKHTTPTCEIPDSGTQTLSSTSHCMPENLSEVPAIDKLPDNQVPGSVSGHVIGPGAPTSVEGHIELDRGPRDRAREERHKS